MLLLFVLADFGEAETFPEDHLLRKVTFPAAKKCLLERIFFPFIALEGKRYFSLAVKTLSIFQIGQV